MYEHLIKRANTVIEALPYLRRFHGKIMIIKYGGTTLGNPEIKEKMVQDLVLLCLVNISPILVHGGGPEITKVLEGRGIKSKFIEGLRVTTPQIMKIVEKVLISKNKEIAKEIEKAHGKAASFYGKKGNIIRTKKYFVTTTKGKKLDLGFTGIVKGINKTPLLRTIKDGFIPVVTSLGVGEGGKLYNVNADQAASSIAASLKVSKLIILTDVKGVLDHDGNLIPEINSKQINNLIKNGIISGGMVPKVKAGLHALKKGVKKVHIIDGRIPHALLLEVFTDTGIGTMVVK